MKLLATIRRLEEEKAELQRKAEESILWVKPTLKMMSRSGYKEFRRAAALAKDDFAPGTNSLIRKTLGINISVDPTPPSPEENKLAVAIRQFANINSDESPNRRMAAKGIRVFWAYKCVMWWHFLGEQDLHCSYSTFCKWWPSHIIKPKIADYDR